jgi:S-layer homology domain
MPLLLIITKIKMKKQWKGFLIGLVAGITLTAIVGVSVGGEALQGRLSFKDLSSTKVIDSVKVVDSIKKEIQFPPEEVVIDNHALNRAEFSKLLVVKLGVNPAGYSGCATDLVNHWAEPYMCYLVDEGIIDTFLNGEMRPSTLINRAESAKILTSVFDIIKHHPDLDSNAWYFESILALGAKGVYNVNDGDNFRPAESIRRLELDYWLSNL